SAKRAMEARRRAGEAAAEGIRLVGALRGLPVASLLERARAAITDLEVPPAFVAALPGDPSDAAPVAREWAAAAGELRDIARAACEAQRAAMSDLLASARSSVPGGVDIEAAETLDDLLNA